VLAAAGAAGGGGAFVVGKVAVAHLPPVTIAALRYVIALALFAALLAAERQPWPRPSAREWALLVGMGLSAIAGYNIVFLEALRHAPASEGGLIVPGSAPIFVAILTAAVFREPPTRRAWLGVAIGTAGLLLLFAAVGGFSAGTLDRRFGEALFLLGGLCWAIFFACARSIHGRIHSLPANTYAAAIGLAVLIPAALVIPGQSALARIEPAGLIEVGYLAVFATVLLLWANVRAVERLGLARAAPFSYFAPVAAVAGAALFLGERPGWLQILGGAIALVGTWLAAHSPRPEPAPREAELKEAAANS
jgi:drug/metabolite transporter (DMT)-like permease